MDCSRRDRHRNFAFVNSSELEPEYDVVDDQEEMLSVRILPARPLYEEREYADRDLPRSSSAQSLSSLSTGNSNSLSRDVPHNPTSGPAINRDLKPGRKKTTKLVKRLLPHPGEQHSNRSYSSPPPFVSELASRLSGLALHEPCRRDGQKATKKAQYSPQSRGLERADCISIQYTNQRHSLDLETHDLDKRSQQNLERVASKRHHHEWPQTKDDFDQHDFVPMGRPQQTYCEEDWYIGPCNRSDAEHALHLVNRDGAFLVRDCSVNTNSEPLVLAVYHDKKVYNVKIRFIESSNKYILGTGQRTNDMFDSVAAIIKFHSIFPIVLISGRNMPGSRYPENCVLTMPVTKQDVDQLLC